MANVVQSPQVAFRGRRLTVPTSVGQNFVLLSLVIGVNFQQAAAGQVPMLLFSPDAVGQNLGLETCQIGQQITMSVQNIDAVAAHDFRAGLTGVAIGMTAC